MAARRRSSATADGHAFSGSGTVVPLIGWSIRKRCRRS